MKPTIPPTKKPRNQSFLSNLFQSTSFSFCFFAVRYFKRRDTLCTDLIPERRILCEYLMLLMLTTAVSVLLIRRPREGASSFYWWLLPRWASPAFAALRVPLRCAKGTGGFRLSPE